MIRDLTGFARTWRTILKVEVNGTLPREITPGWVSDREAYLGIYLIF